MTVWVSLLRGTNLGARNKVPMPALREALTAAGLRDVRTYVQSGNVVSRSAHRSATTVARVVHDVIAEEFGLDIPVVARTPAELAAVLEWNPFPDAAAERPKVVQVTHLFGEPRPADVERLLAAAEPLPEQVAVRGQEVVVDHGTSIQGSKVHGAWLSKRLGGIDGTSRNWRTLTALVEMTAD